VSLVGTRTNPAKFTFWDSHKSLELASYIVQYIDGDVAGLTHYI